VWGNVTVGNESYQLGRDEFQPLLNSDGTEATEPTSTGLLLRHVKKVMILTIVPNVDFPFVLSSIPRLLLLWFFPLCSIFVDSCRERAQGNDPQPHIENRFLS
jgi:hypothetical protein